MIDNIPCFDHPYPYRILSRTRAGLFGESLT